MLSVALFHFFKIIYLAALVLVVACGISIFTVACDMWDLVPYPGLEPGAPALGAQSFSHWTPREAPQLLNQVVPALLTASRVCTATSCTTRLGALWEQNRGICYQSSESSQPVRMLTGQGSGAPSAECGAGSQTRSDAQRHSCWKRWVTQTIVRGAGPEGVHFPHPCLNVLWCESFPIYLLPWFHSSAKWGELFYKRTCVHFFSLGNKVIYIQNGKCRLYRRISNEIEITFKITQR